MPLKDETGNFYFSQYGSKYTLGFEGTPEFIERSYNLFYNFQATNGKLFKIHDGLGYIVVKNKEKIQKALESYFYTYLLPQFKIKEEYDEDKGWLIEYNEKGLEKQSKIEAEQFMTKIIVRDFKSMKGSNDSYSVSEFKSVYNSGLSAS